MAIRFAKAAGSEVKENTIQFSPGLAVGFQVYLTGTWFYGLVNNYHLEDDFVFNREPTEFLE